MQVFVIKYLIKWQYLWEGSQQREKLPEFQFLCWHLKLSSVSSIKCWIFYSMKGLPSKGNKPGKIYGNVVFTAWLCPPLFTIKLWVISTIIMHLNFATSHESSSSRCCFLVSSSSSIPIHLSWLPVLCNFAMTWCLLEILSPGLLLHSIYFLLNLGGRKIILRELVREAVKGNCRNEEKGKWDGKMAAEDLDLRVGEEGGVGDKRKWSECFSLLFSFPTCLGYLTLKHEL